MGIKATSIPSRCLTIALLSCIVQCSPLKGLEQNVPALSGSNENTYRYINPYGSSESSELSQPSVDSASNDQEEDYVYEEDEDITPYLPEEFFTPAKSQTSAGHDVSKDSAPGHGGAPSVKGPASGSTPGQSKKATITKGVMVKVQPPPPVKFKAGELSHFKASLDHDDDHERDMLEPGYWPSPQQQLPPALLNIYYDYHFLTGQLPPGTIVQYQSEYTHGRDDWQDQHYEKYSDFQSPGQAQKALKGSGYSQQPQQLMLKQDSSSSIHFDTWK